MKSHIGWFCFVGGFFWGGGAGGSRVFSEMDPNSFHFPKQSLVKISLESDHFSPDF